MRFAHYFALLAPPIIISATFVPEDLFSKFNMFPEQVVRVSVTQYSKTNVVAYTHSIKCAFAQIYNSESRNLFGMVVNQADRQVRYTDILADRKSIDEAIIS